MRTDDLQRFKALLTDAMAFYRRDVSEFALSVWWQACKDFAYEQVAKAITQHAMDPEQGRFAPMPADIVKQLQGTKTDRSLMAWSLVYEAIKDHGAYATVKFSDPATQLAIHDMGGWVKLCATEMDELQFVQKRFCDFYRSYSGRPDLREVPTLPGIHDQDPRRVTRKVIVIGAPTPEIPRLAA
jgi:hypothetical protein